MKSYPDDELKVFQVENFSKGFNSYPGSNTLVDDNEFPQGQNVYLDNNGAVSKVQGSSKFTTNELNTGHAVYGLGILKNSTYNKVISVSGDKWYEVSSGTPAEITGSTFQTDKQTDFCQAIDRLYGANGVDDLAYTDNGTTVNKIASNGNIGRWPVSYNRRLYMTNSANPDRIYYSNPYGIALTAPPTYTTTYFGTFDTDLSTTIDGGNKKNAGFIILMPGAGLEITRLYKDVISGSEYIFAYTKNHGIWKIAYGSTNTDGTIVHTIQQISTSIGSPAGNSITTVGNDQWFFGRDNYYTLGEVAQYSNLRVSPKAGRIVSEIESILPTMVENVSSVYYKNKLYVSYGTTTYNNKIIIYDAILNAWSAPRTGVNANCFVVWENDDGVNYLLSGSSLSTDSRIHRLATGLNDSSGAIQSNFTTKSYNCNLSGIIKYFAFIDVFYTTIYGELSYETFIDEVYSVGGTLTLGNSNDGGIGVGSQTMGEFMVCDELDDAATFATLKKNDSFRIYLGFVKGKNISVKFTNNNTGESFKINGIKIYYQPGSVYETA